MKERFEFLLQKYLEQSATPEEEQELRQLSLTDEYEEEFKASIARFMEQDFQKKEKPDFSFDADSLFKQISTRKAAEFEDHQGWIFPWQWLRIAALVVLGLGIGWWSITNFLTTEPVQIAEINTTDDDSIVVISKKDFIRLPDGSTVLLNEHSRLVYHLPFGERNRFVELEGEAFFDITHNPGKPFIVQTGKISTRVLGTAFNVNAREKNVVVTVERGLVEVNAQNTTLGLVRPAERLTVAAEDNKVEKTDVNLGEAIKWKAENLVFDNLTLGQAIDRLEDHFKVKIELENPGIENCRIDAWFLHQESLDEILEMVFGIRQATYTKNDNLVTISGGIPCNPLTR